MIKLNPGDLCVTATPTELGRLIRFIEKEEYNLPGLYSHAFFVVDCAGKILESEGHYGYGNISEYAGYNTLIVRANCMCDAVYQNGFDAVKSDIGELYPAWRLLMFLLDTEKYCHFADGTCMEQVAKFMHGCGLCDKMYGLSPDHGGLMFRDMVAKGTATIINDGPLVL